MVVVSVVVVAAVVVSILLVVDIKLPLICDESTY